MSTELFLHVPAASIALLSEEQHEPYMQKLQDLPQKTRDTATSVKVAAYIRGLVKSHRLPEAHGPIIAQNLFRVLIAEYPLAQMPAHLSSETGIANDVAQRIATEIEKDVLAPIALELNKHTSQAQKNTSSMASKL